MILHKLEKEGLLKDVPGFLVDNTHYLVMHGSHMYGINREDSDKDIYGWCIPPKDEIFRHLRGEIEGFGRQKTRFEQYSEPHIDYQGEGYDVTVFGIVKFFHLCMENNPNVIETLFAPVDCILHTTSIGNMVREFRHEFLHKGVYPKMKGYAYSQLSKMKSQNRVGSRAEGVAKYGYDLKFAGHTVRLLLEAEMVLAEKDLDLRRHREQLKSIRRGEWSLEQVVDWADAKEKQLEKLYHDSDLKWGPDEGKIKGLLLSCLESHYGSLDKCIAQDENAYKGALEEIRVICKRMGI